LLLVVFGLLHDLKLHRLKTFLVAWQQMFVAGQQRLPVDFMQQLAGLIQEQWGERQ